MAKPSCPFAQGAGTPQTTPAAQRARFTIAEELAFLSEAGAPGSAEERSARQTLCARALEAGDAAPLSTAELTWAARLAWRNHARCIGRLHWRSLQTRDRRDVAEPQRIFDELLAHHEEAYHGGAIRAALTVFAPAERSAGGPRIWNHQLFGYAGYRSRDGSVLGDPKNAAFTELALALGWNRPAARTAFDLLPLIISGRDGRPKLFELPPQLAQEVAITHPEHAWFSELGLRWYTLPMITDMHFHAAGTDYCAAPFNGWYMGTEIGARNLADEGRYNQLPKIAARLGLDTRKPQSLWKDRALVELNRAVLHSFAERGVKIVDHHTAAEEFMRFSARETREGRTLSARWDWIVPPLSPATTEVYHTPMTEETRTPDFQLQAAPRAPREAD